MIFTYILIFLFVIILTIIILYFLSVYVFPRKIEEIQKMIEAGQIKLAIRKLNEILEKDERNRQEEKAQDAENLITEENPQQRNGRRKADVGPDNPRLDELADDVNTPVEDQQADAQTRIPDD